MKKTFSESLRTAIKSSGLSLRELGRRAEVSQSVLSRFMSGARPSIDTGTVDKLWVALRLKVCEEKVEK